MKANQENVNNRKALPNIVVEINQKLSSLPDNHKNRNKHNKADGNNCDNEQSCKPR